MNEELVYLLLWCDTGDGAVRLEATDEPIVDAAVQRYVDSGKTIDSLLSLTSTGGDSFKVLASSISSWTVSTPAARDREREIDAAMEAEGGEPWQQNGEGY